MPRYFFDIHEDDAIRKDEEGVELADYDQARKEAQRLLPEIAYHEVPKDGDRKIYVVLVTDQEGHPVYSATLNYTGLSLLRTKTAAR